MSVRAGDREVALMKIKMTERLTALPFAFAPAPAAAALGVPLANTRLRPWARHLVTEAEQAQARSRAGGDGTSEFAGKGVRSSYKRMDASGIPPRGRPV